MVVVVAAVDVVAVDVVKLSPTIDRIIFIPISFIDDEGVEEEIEVEEAEEEAT